MDAALKSGLYECEVVHERLAPKRHGFRYQVFFMDLWLDELPQLHRQLKLFSFAGPNVFSFYDEDHLDLGAGNLRLNLQKWLREKHGLPLPEDWSIRLVTFPRVLGYLFNPVCFYFLYDAQGQVRHALCEVTNTFQEMKPYLLETPSSPGKFEAVMPKHFYVSPFSSLDTSFHFQLQVPDDGIKIHIDDLLDGQKVLVSWIHGTRRSLTDMRLAWFCFRYPALTLQVILKIHWQAFLLWKQNIAFHQKSARPDLQRDLYRPHSSLAPSSPP
jgi:DUF1365 family protein